MQLHEASRFIIMLNDEYWVIAQTVVDDMSSLF